MDIYVKVGLGVLQRESRGECAMTSQVYFTRPGKEEEVTYYLIGDIRYAKKRILLSMAYFSDYEILGEIKENPRAEKMFLFNKSDVVNNQTTYNTLVESGYNVTLLGTHQRISDKKTKTSSMHHKFIIIDDVVWLGSYNFSQNARENNWENMIRIEDKRIVEIFVREYYQMFRLGLLPNPTINGELKSYPGGKPAILFTRCSKCNFEYNNPFEHYYLIIECETLIHRFGSFTIEDGPFGVYFPFQSDTEEYQEGNYRVKFDCVEGSKEKEVCSNCGQEQFKYNHIKIIESATHINITKDVNEIRNGLGEVYKGHLTYNESLGVYVNNGHDSKDPKHYCIDCINECIDYLNHMNATKSIYKGLIR